MISHITDGLDVSFKRVERTAAPRRSMNAEYHHTAVVAVASTLPAAASYENSRRQN